MALGRFRSAMGAGTLILGAGALRAIGCGGAEASGDDPVALPQRDPDGGGRGDADNAPETDAGDAAQDDVLREPCDARAAFTVIVPPVDIPRRGPDRGPKKSVSRSGG